jgi:hypothetical protein
LRSTPLFVFMLTTIIIIKFLMVMPLIFLIFQDFSGNIAHYFCMYVCVAKIKGYILSSRLSLMRSKGSSTVPSLSLFASILCCLCGGCAGERNEFTQNRPFSGTIVRFGIERWSKTYKRQLYFAHTGPIFRNSSVNFA